MDYSCLDKLAQELGCVLQKDEAMSLHTSFKIGGKADRFISVKNHEQLSEILTEINRSNLPFIIVGNGSNLLVSDKGIRGVVIALSGEFSKIELLEDGMSILCGAGVKLATLCRFAADNGLTGIEFAYGIPGTVGGAVFMNAGAYGGEMADIVRKTYHMDICGATGDYTQEQLELSYRHSAYEGSGLVITHTIIKLKRGDKAEIEEKMAQLMEKRQSKQPYDMPSAGSTFKRPEGAFAAALIEECGLKGKSVGDAEVSPKHAGFIVNNGNAKCEDVLKLIDAVKAEVFTRRNIRLECEVKVIGEL